jgi:hypothetical protein
MDNRPEVEKGKWVKAKRMQELETLHREVKSWEKKIPYFHYLL